MDALVTWKDPVGPWLVERNGLALPPTATIKTGDEVKVRVQTLCEGEELTVEAVATQDGPVSRFARQCQIAASIQHVTRRACKACRDQYQSGLNPTERKWLYAQEPRLGPILGVASETRKMAEKDRTRRDDVRGRIQRIMSRRGQ